MKKQILLHSAAAKTLTLSTLLSLLFYAGFSQILPTANMYLGQPVPGTTPKIFQLAVTPGLAAAERIVISADNREIYYGELDNWPASSQRIKQYKFNGTAWQGPFVVFEGYIGPALSANDSIMYMQKMLNNNTQVCTYYSRRNGAGWTAPQRLLSMNRHTHYYQETDQNNIFTASSSSSSGSVADLYKMNIRNGDSTLQNLGIPINTTATENDFFIARDESYIIFCRFPAGSAGDLYISYKTEDGRWTNPKTLGTQVNTPNPNWEACPFVTKDNKYLFFMRGGNALSSYFIYWVAVDNLIDSLKLTNFAPYVRYSLQNQTFKTGRSNTFTIPDSSFIDDDGNPTLTLTASLGNGNPLPDWLNFDPVSATFTGTPTEPGSIIVKVTATDPAALTARSSFTVQVVDASGVDNQAFDSNIRLFPNPVKDQLHLSFGSNPYQKANIQIFNTSGEIIVSSSVSSGSTATIDLTGKARGIYFLLLNIDGEIINRKFYLE